MTNESDSATPPFPYSCLFSLCYGIYLFFLKHIIVTVQPSVWHWALNKQIYIFIKVALQH